MGAHLLNMPVLSSVPKSDYSQFISAAQCSFFVGTWVLTRVAAGNVVQRWTSADATSIIVVPVSQAIRTAANKGVKIKSFDVVYDVDVVDLDAHTALCHQRTSANSVASAVATHGGTLSGTLSIASADADPLVTTLTLGTPVFLNTALIDVTLEITVDAAATSDYDFHGVHVNFDVNHL